MPSTGFYPDYINTSLSSGGEVERGGGRTHWVCDACPNHSSVWEQASFTTRLTPCSHQISPGEVKLLHTGREGAGGGDCRSSQILLTSINGFITETYCNITLLHIYCNIWDAQRPGLEIRYQFSLSLYSSKSGYLILFWPITLILLDRKLNLIKRFYFSFSLFIRGHWRWWVADNKAQLRELKYLGVAKIRSVAIIVAKRWILFNL